MEADWLLDAELLTVGWTILKDVGSWTMGAGNWTMDVGQGKSVRSWMLDAGMLDSGRLTPVDT